jgi:hypothetical protein
MILSGTRLTVSSPYVYWTGYLDSNEEDLDGVFVLVNDDDGKRIKVKGWLYRVTILDPEPEVCPNRPICGAVWEARGPLPIH